MEDELLRLRNQLSRIVMEKELLTDPCVLKVSQELDLIILEIQKQLVPSF